MKCVFVANDGKEFDSKEQCMAYEKKKVAEAEARELKLRELEEANKKKQEEKKRRYEEVSAAWENYRALVEKYYSDYKEDDWLTPEYDDLSTEDSKDNSFTCNISAEDFENLLACLLS